MFSTSHESNITNMLKRLEVSGGSSIPMAYAKCVKEAQESHCTVYFEGNGIIFLAQEDSDPQLAEKYLDFCYRYKLPVLGPNEPMITSEYKEKMDKENQEEEERMRERMQKEVEKDKINRKNVEFLIKNVIYLVSDKKKLDELFPKNEHQSQSDYYNALAQFSFDYAITLGKLLQIIGANYNKQDVERCESMIGYMGPSGFSRSISILILKETWAYFKPECF